MMSTPPTIPIIVQSSGSKIILARNNTHAPYQDSKTRQLWTRTFYSSLMMKTCFNTAVARYREEVHQQSIDKTKVPNTENNSNLSHIITLIVTIIISNNSIYIRQLKLIQHNKLLSKIIQQHCMQPYDSFRNTPLFTHSRICSHCSN